MHCCNKATLHRTQAQFSLVPLSTAHQATYYAFALGSDKTVFLKV